MASRPQLSLSGYLLVPVTRPFPPTWHIPPLPLRTWQRTKKDGKGAGVPPIKTQCVWCVCVWRSISTMDRPPLGMQSLLLQRSIPDTDTLSFLLSILAVVVYNIFALEGSFLTSLSGHAPTS